MHELSVTESILEISLRHAEDAHAKRVLGLNLVIGELASIVDDSVQFYWEIIAKDTIAEGAKLNFERIPTVLACVDCNTQYKPDGKELACPSCSSSKIKIVSGKEFFLDSIDIE